MYDDEEMSVLARMKGALISDGWSPDDFEDMSFLDIEAEFLDGHEDFR